MRLVKIISITIVSVSLLITTIFFVTGYFKPKAGGILVDAKPTSSVYINGKYVGKTPFTNIYEKGSVKVTIEPDDLKVDSYQTEIQIVPNMQSVIKYDFTDSDETSTGFSLSSEIDPAKKTGIIVISDPDNAQIYIDGVVQGFTPTKANISSGKHKISIRKVDYLEKNITINLVEGYRLTINTKLAKAPVATPSPSPEPLIKTYIQILDTPTGFLRVRTKPGSSGEEIAEVKPESKYLFLEEDTETGWFKIQYSDPKPGLPDGIQGWVSNQYSKKTEE